MIERLSPTSFVAVDPTVSNGANQFDGDEETFGAIAEATVGAAAIADLWGVPAGGVNTARRTSAKLRVLGRWGTDDLFDGIALGISVDGGSKFSLLELASPPEVFPIAPEGFAWVEFDVSDLLGSLPARLVVVREQFGHGDGETPPPDFVDGGD